MASAHLFGDRPRSVGRAARCDQYRGMFIGLGFATAYVIIRLIIGRYWGLVTAAGVMVVGVVTALIASGTVAAILGRQQYSDSTGGRAALYRSTWAASLESPIVGVWNSPYGIERGCFDGYSGVSMDSNVLFRICGSCYICPLYSQYFG